MDFDQKIEELYLDLPEPAEELGNTLNAVQTGKLLYVGGVYPFKEGRMAYKGRFGVELTLESGRLAGHTACVQALAAIKGALDGSFNKIKKIVMLKGYIASGGDFKDHHKVLDGASQLLVDIFGQNAGRHARSAVGVSSLPFGAAVELELIVEVR